MVLGIDVVKASFGELERRSLIATMIGPSFLFRSTPVSKRYLHRLSLAIRATAISIRCGTILCRILSQMEGADSEFCETPSGSDILIFLKEGGWLSRALQ